MSERPTRELKVDRRAGEAFRERLRDRQRSRREEETEDHYQRIASMLEEWLSDVVVALIHEMVTAEVEKALAERGIVAPGTERTP